MDKALLLIFILLLLLILLFRPKSESFLSPFNVYNTDTSLTSTNLIYNQETTQLNTLFEKINTVSEFPDTNSFTKLSDDIAFQYNDQFKTILADKINSIINSRINIIGNIKNIYSRNQEFIFNAHLIITNQWITRDIRVYIDNFVIKRVIVETNPVTIDDTLTNNFNVQPSFETIKYDPDFQNFYKIKNTLYLMDPFITSGRDMYITDTMRDSFNKIVLEKERQLKKMGVCFFESAPDTPNHSVDRETCLNSNGIWDSPPEESGECPYYLSNKNYPNEFGKLIQDNCQLPLNMKNLGYRYYIKDQLPLCHNCLIKNKANQVSISDTPLNCCNDQLDKNIYPLLVSPDYAFEGDTDLRQKYKIKLNSLIKIPS